MVISIDNIHIRDASTGTKMKTKSEGFVRVILRVGAEHELRIQLLNTPQQPHIVKGA